MFIIRMITAGARGRLHHELLAGLPGVGHGDDGDASVLYHNMIYHTIIV